MLQYHQSCDCQVKFLIWSQFGNQLGFGVLHWAKEWVGVSPSHQVLTTLSPRQVLAELKEYATEVDVDFVRKAVRAIGRCAIKVEVRLVWGGRGSLVVPSPLA